MRIEDRIKIRQKGRRLEHFKLERSKVIKQEMVECIECRTS
jgi:hypothetical protein